MSLAEARSLTRDRTRETTATCCSFLGRTHVVYMQPTGTIQQSEIKWEGMGIEAMQGLLPTLKSAAIKALLLLAGQDSCSLSCDNA